MISENYATQLSQKAFSFFGEAYTQTAQEQFDHLKPYLDEFIKSLSRLDKVRDKILDIGCGPGLLLELLRYYQFQHILGLDISEKAIKEASKRVPAHMLLRHDFHQMKFQPNEFSAIFAINSLHYTSKKSFARIIKNIYYFLDNNGRFFLSLPEGDGESVTEEKYTEPQTGKTKSHMVYRSYYQVPELEEILEENGFQIDPIQKPEKADCFNFPIIISTATKKP